MSLYRSLVFSSTWINNSHSSKIFPFWQSVSPGILRFYRTTKATELSCFWCSCSTNVIFCMAYASCVEKHWDRYKLWREGKVKELRRSCLSILLLWRDTIAMTTLIKESILFGLGYNFKGLLHHQHGMEHRNMHKDACSFWGRSWEFYICICRQQEERKSCWAWLGLFKPPKKRNETFPPRKSHLLKWGHTS